MAEYYACMINDSGATVSATDIEEVFNSLKDWLRFSRHAYLVYTDVKPSVLRARLRERFAEQDPSILVIKADPSVWSAYAKDLPRIWLRKERGQDLKGE